MNGDRLIDAGAATTALAEPRPHSHVTDGLRPNDPLAVARVYLERCATLLHMQTNSECVAVADRAPHTALTAVPLEPRLQTRREHPPRVWPT